MSPRSKARIDILHVLLVSLFGLDGTACGFAAFSLVRARFQDGYTHLLSVTEL